MEKGLTPVEQTGIVAEITKKVEKQKQEKTQRKHNSTKRQKHNITDSNGTRENKRPNSTKGNKTISKQEQPKSSAQGLPINQSQLSGISERPASSSETHSAYEVSEKQTQDKSQAKQNADKEDDMRDETSKSNNKTDKKEYAIEPNSDEQAKINVSPTESPPSEPVDSQINVNNQDDSSVVKTQNNQKEHGPGEDKVKKPTFIVEQFDVGAKKTSNFTITTLRDACRIRFTRDDNLIVLDQELGILIQYNGVTGDKIKQFRYLLNHSFQGGFAVTRENKVLVALKNEKYSSISFYNLDGKFKFSAFLNKDAAISCLFSETVENIVSLDQTGQSVYSLNREKRLDNAINLPKLENDLCEVTAVAITSNSVEDIIVADSSNNCIRYYDNKGEFTKSIKHKKSESDTFSSIECVVTNSTDCLLSLDRTSEGDRLDLFDPEGKYIGCPVMVTSGSIVDFDCSGLDKLVTLVRCNDLTSIRIYTLQLPRKYRKAPTQTKVSTFSKVPQGQKKNQVGVTDRLDKDNREKVTKGSEKKKNLNEDKDNDNKNADSSNSESSCCCIII